MSILYPPPPERKRRRDEGGGACGGFTISGDMCLVLLLSWINSEASLCTMARFSFSGGKCYAEKPPIRIWFRKWSKMEPKEGTLQMKRHTLIIVSFLHSFFLIIALWSICMTTALWHHSASRFVFGEPVMCCWPVCPSSPHPQPQFPSSLCFQLVFFSGWTATDTSCLYPPAHGVQLGGWK